jgi:hypothetical protein
LSALFDANGGAKESLEGCMTWEDVDVDVFLRFAQFVYTGAYASFAPAEREIPAGHTEGAGGITMDVDEEGPEVTASPEPLEENRKGRFQLPYSLASYMTATGRTDFPLCDYTGRSYPLRGGVHGTKMANRYLQRFHCTRMLPQTRILRAKDIQLII